ncbi:MAG: hypothetical protein HC892_20715 [Saprospiraceae bacterium]|nr:hypothetical protein [Saprospiraceae bacterium]
MEYKITLDGRLPSLNEYIKSLNSHRQNGAKMKRDVEECISWQLVNQIRGIELTPPLRMCFTWIEASNKRDLDNIAFAKKFILDAMVGIGFLKNDNRKNMRGFQDDFPEVIHKPKGKNF